MKGDLVFFFAFDIANEVLPDLALGLLRERGLLAERDATPVWPRGPALTAPLLIAFPGRADMLGGAALGVELRLFEFGAISVVMRAPFAVTALTELTSYTSHSLGDGRRPEELARESCVRICIEIQPALVRPSSVGEPESYLAFRVCDLDGVDDVEQWLAANHAEVAGLLTGVPFNRISSGQMDEVFRYQRSLTRTDTVVLAWDAALVVDLVGDAADVLFTIELANLQLEEFRRN